MPTRTTSLGELDYGAIERVHKVFDPFTLIFEMGPTLIRAARSLRRKDAVSYRGVEVAAATISINQVKRVAKWFVGVNYKPNEDASKYCAEMEALGKAKKEKFDWTSGLFVVGPKDLEIIESITGRRTPTLPPCTPCRDHLYDSTVVISIAEDDDLYEVHSGRQLWELYRPAEKWKKTVTPASLPPILDPGFSNLSLARNLYLERTRELTDIPEIQTRVIRAEAVVDALHEAAA